jgi:hypothetical protein
MFFLKSGEKKNLIELQKNGRVYMKSLSYFEKCEDISRKDSLEKATFIINNPPKPYYLKVKRYNVEEEYITVGLINNSIGKGYEGYIFCMHYLNLGDETEKDFQIKSKDDHMLIINSNLFLKALKDKLEEDKTKYKYGLIRYKDFNSYVGDKTPFEKDLTYKDEYEFRLFIPMKETKEFHDFYLRGISKFSTLIKASSLSSFKLEKKSSENLQDVIYI